MTPNPHRGGRFIYRGGIVDETDVPYGVGIFALPLREQGRTRDHRGGAHASAQAEEEGQEEEELGELRRPRGHRRLADSHDDDTEPGTTAQRHADDVPALENVGNSEALSTLPHHRRTAIDSEREHTRPWF